MASYKKVRHLRKSVKSGLLKLIYSTFSQSHTLLLSTIHLNYIWNINLKISKKQSSK